ncbi:MAG: type I restriction endonuclease [Burkholderiales bacterium]
MSGKHKERVFEDDLCAHLAAHGWLYSPNDAGYDRDRALFPEDVLWWVKETQRDEWDKLAGWHNGDTETLFLDRLCKVLDDHGSLAGLRHGFKATGAGTASFDLCQFKPSHGLNAEIASRYAKVRLRVMRQVHYSLHNENAMDLVFFVNGIPVATAELKTDFTQSIHDAVRQYKRDRPPKDAKTRKAEPLLAFRRRALVHFAVSTDEVRMATELRGEDTVFLPFNLGHDGGAGNPPNPAGYRTAYLWERVLERDAWLGILGSFVHLEKKDKVLADSTKKTVETLIFPRFHQWEAVTSLVAAAKVEGPGRSYLVQHSAGSGKTNSISWLSHQLASVHDASDRKVFDSVLVVTDRTVLDAQLQDAIYQFEHKHGVVARIDAKEGAKSARLAEALLEGRAIIIVTLQTFPFVMSEIVENTSLKTRRFAVIVDEAHSSMTGASAAKLRGVLTAEQIDEGAEVSAEDLLLAATQSRKPPPNASFFAFTATPKAKTIELFGRPPDPVRPPAVDNVPQPFHVYSMQQAIEEGFILDVLRNYTPYNLAYQLAYAGREIDDREVEKSRGLKHIARWVRLHPHNISQKVAICVDHFRHAVRQRLAGRAKAMVVTASRKEAVRYKLAIDRYVREQRYPDVAALVAFSGDVDDAESGADKFNEHTMNPGLRGRDIREAFATDEFNVLVVANKYQTGFDQPLLAGMYVDKRLDGVQAVQTLSRLNRTHQGKEEVFILDFVNDPGEVRLAFEPYFRTAAIGGVSDPNVVHDLQGKLDAEGVYLESEVDAFASVFFDRNSSQKELQAHIAPAVDRFRDRTRAAKAGEDSEALDNLEIFRKNLGSFIRAYDFLAQIYDYGDTDLEKRYVFYRHLLPWLRPDRERDAVDLKDLHLTHYRVKGGETTTLKLGERESVYELPVVTDLGTAEARDEEKAKLSELVRRINDLFEGELSDADKVAYVNHLAGKMLESDKLARQAEINTKEQFRLGDFHDVMMDTVIEALDNHKAMTSQVLASERTKSDLADVLLEVVYEGFRRRQTAPPA